MKSKTYTIAHTVCEMTKLLMKEHNHAELVEVIEITMSRNSTSEGFISVHPDPQREVRGISFIDIPEGIEVKAVKLRFNVIRKRRRKPESLVRYAIYKEEIHKLSEKGEFDLC